MIRGFVTAVTFLTRVPAGGASSFDLARSVGWFPVVGLGVGAFVGLTAWGGAVALPPLVAAALAVGLGMLVTGALHEDGLADTFDALGSGRDREQTLQIMKDSRLGTFGAAALIVTLVAKIGALAALPGILPLLVAPAAGALSRGAAVAVMALVPPARRHGLGAEYVHTLTRWRAAVAVVVTLGLATALLGAAVVPGVLAATAGAAFVTLWATRRLGGVTGDVFGAVIQVVEVAVLIALSVTAVHTWVPW